MEKAPAPWHLTGDGYIFVYKLPNAFGETNGFLTTFQKKHFKGGLATIMCVNYESSAVGPYFELLFIPGLINLKRLNLRQIKAGFTISKIYVSSQASVINGIENWGIPKQLADFQWQKNAKNELDLKVSIDNNLIFEAILKNGQVKIPISTRILPLKIIQEMNSKIYLTSPHAKGKLTWAKIKSIQVSDSFFPNISLLKPLIGLNICNFKMEFPEAIIEKID